MSWTPQQLAVFDAVAKHSGHVCVEAVAGSGKTTTCVAAARVAGGRVGFTAFNKHIAAELQQRLGDGASACTLHSLGFTACKRAWGSKLNENKLKQLLQELKPGWFYNTNRGVKAKEDAKAAMDLARLCKYSLIDGTRSELLDDLVEHHGVNTCGLPAMIYAAVGELLDRCQRDTDQVDFDDMVWLPVVKSVPTGEFDLLFVDECQDLSRMQHMLALRAGRRLVMVGDSSQALYGFSGADTESMGNLRDMLNDSTGCVDRPLTVTFRCPTAHVELAKRIVPTIEAAAGARDGLVYQVVPSILPRFLLPGDMAICRLNAPLVELTYQLVTAGVPAMMRGRDIGRGLLELIEQLKPADVRELLNDLGDYGDSERERMLRRDAPESALQAMEDRVGCLQKLCCQVRSLNELRDFIGTVFADDAPEGKVILSSVHRAKGLEADRVVIVAPEKLPLVRKDQKDWERVQEANLCYVAATRAKRELVFAGDVPTIFGPVRCKTPLF